MSHDDIPIDWMALARAEGFLQEGEELGPIHVEVITDPIPIRGIPKPKDTRDPNRDINVVPSKVFEALVVNDFRQIPGWPSYFINVLGNIRGRHGLPIKAKVGVGTTQARLYVGQKSTIYYRTELVHWAFPEIAPKYVENLIWYEGHAYIRVPNHLVYAVSEHGMVLNTETWGYVALGRQHISVRINGRTTSRSRKKLVCAAWGVKEVLGRCDCGRFKGIFEVE